MRVANERRPERRLGGV